MCPRHGYRVKKHINLTYGIFIDRFRQPLLQCVKTSVKGFCPVPTAMKNIRNTVHRSEAKRSRQFRKQIFAVRLFPEVPQKISGGICRAFSVRLEIDTVFWIFTEK